MNLLFDTHALLWFLEGNKNLPRRWRSVRPGDTHECLFSLASYWELGLKMSLGKLRLSLTYERMLEEALGRNFRILPVQPEHCQEAARLPWLHRDPFDRMLVAQARVEDLTILSGDERIAEYEVKHKWD